MVPRGGNPRPSRKVGGDQGKGLPTHSRRAWGPGSLSPGGMAFTSMARSPECFSYMPREFLDTWERAVAFACVWLPWTLPCRRDLEAGIVTFLELSPLLGGTVSSRKGASQGQGRKRMEGQC